MDRRAGYTEPEDEQPPHPATRDQHEHPTPRPRWRRHPELIILTAFTLTVAAFITSRTHTAHPDTATPTTSSSTQASPAQMLADLDGDTTPILQYQAAIGVLTPECTQDQAGIAALANAGYQDLVKNGITDETRLTVLRHLAASMPPGSAPIDCAGVLSAYLVLRES